MSPFAAARFVGVGQPRDERFDRPSVLLPSGLIELDHALRLVLIPLAVSEALAQA